MGTLSTRYRLHLALCEDDESVTVEVCAAQMAESLATGLPVRVVVTGRDGVSREMQAEARPV